MEEEYLVNDRISDTGVYKAAPDSTDLLNMASLLLRDIVSFVLFFAAPTGSSLCRISCGGLGLGAGLVYWDSGIAAATEGEI